MVFVLSHLSQRDPLASQRTHRGHVFLRELVGGIGDEQTCLTHSSITHNYTLYRLHDSPTRNRLLRAELGVTRLFFRLSQLQKMAYTVQKLSSLEVETKIWRNQSFGLSIFTANYFYIHAADAACHTRKNLFLDRPVLLMITCT